jgi:hypothetical protein
VGCRFQFVADNRGAFGVKRLCRMLKVSRSGFYWRLAGAEARADRARADAELTERITEIHQKSDGTYGAPRVTAELRDGGERVNHKRRGARVMRKFSIIGFHLRKKRSAPPSPSPRRRPSRTSCSATSLRPSRTPAI